MNTNATETDGRGSNCTHKPKRCGGFRRTCRLHQPAARRRLLMKFWTKMVLGTAAVTAVVCGLGYALGCEDTPASDAPASDVAAKTKYTREKAAEKPREDQERDVAGEEVTEDEGDQEDLNDTISKTAFNEKEDADVETVLNELIAAVEDEQIAGEVRLALGRVVEQVVAQSATNTRSTQSETEAAAHTSEAIEPSTDGSNQLENSEAEATTKDEDRPEEEAENPEIESGASIKRYSSLTPYTSDPHLTAARSRSSNNDEDL